MKRFHPFYLTLLFLLGFNHSNAQTDNKLYMPYEIKQAYSKGTRSIDGKPGENYFQNQANYNIKAEFFPETKMLTGTEIINYRNNGLDSLGNFYLNLFQNLYKKGVSRDMDIDPQNIHDGVEITAFIMNGIAVDVSKIHYYSTIARVKLPTKIAPASNAKIEISWRQKMPVTDVKRHGTYNKTNFFIAYWYPKVCVFDDIEGWNAEGHKGSAEFYSDFGNFDVEITVPSDYTVWSTGELVNDKNVFSSRITERLEKALKSDTVVHIITTIDRNENTMAKPEEKLTWKFNAENQPDFAFALSNKYIWDAASVTVGDKKIMVNSVYDPEAEFFNAVNGISIKSLDYYSKKSPAIKFPFDQITTFHGRRGGMEFPGMINDSDYNNEMETILVTTHELGHMYFPFYVGTNEQKYGWMDEGLVSLIGLFAMADQIGDKEHKIFALLGKKYNEAANMQATDSPIMFPSYELSDQAAGFTTYVKPASAFYLLYDYMGQEKFWQAIREFSVRWKGKHPTPYDMFFTFNEIAGENLDWFWKPWFFEYGYADLGIGKVESVKNEILINIENYGNYPLPISLTATYKDGSKVSISRKMNEWQSENTIKIAIPSGDLKELLLNSEMIPESDYSNNKKVY